MLSNVKYHQNTILPQTGDSLGIVVASVERQTVGKFVNRWRRRRYIRAKRDKRTVQKGRRALRKISRDMLDIIHDVSPKLPPGMIVLMLVNYKALLVQYESLILHLSYCSPLILYFP